MIQNINRGVMIPVVCGAAIRASPLPDGKVFNQRILFATDGTGLAGGEEAGNANNLSSVLKCLVFQLPDKLTP